jgi:hypothetical protein
MGLRVVGAGVGRTGTLSLKLALERLLGEPCYHMIEVFAHPEHVAIWRAATRGAPVDWPDLMDGFGAAVDWPAAAYWPELSAAFPEALILLSTRVDAEAWWRSASATILTRSDDMPAAVRPTRDMALAVFANRFTDRIEDHDACVAAYEAHNRAVREQADPARLLEWQPGDGWEPICRALELPVPDEPFPHTNTTAEFQAAFRSPPDS